MIRWCLTLKSDGLASGLDSWHDSFMPKGGKNTDRDFSTIARGVVERAIGETLTGDPLPDPNHGKNPAAVARGRAGGTKGGKARAEKLSPSKRKAIAKKAAAARWRK
jgi:hypothetical protein